VFGGIFCRSVGDDQVGQSEAGTAWRQDEYVAWVKNPVIIICFA
jgi:hypothetical protein